MKNLHVPRKLIFLSLVSASVIITTLTIFFFAANRDTTSPAANDFNSTDALISDDNGTGDITPASPKDKPSAKVLIEEWGVGISLPVDMQGMLAYSLGAIVEDPDGNKIQAAKVFVKSSALPGHECTITNTSVGDSVDVGTQYIRSEASKPFDSKRYRWSFKENILSTDQYNYHLNYLIPDCTGSSANKLEVLQQAMINLEEMD